MCGGYDVPAVARRARSARGRTRCRPGPTAAPGARRRAYFLERTVDDAARAARASTRSSCGAATSSAAFPYRDAARAGPTTPATTSAASTWRSSWSAEQPRRRARRRGTGVALYVERAGGLWESADVTVERDGRVVVRSEHLAARPGPRDRRSRRSPPTALGVSIDDVVLRFGDSDEAPRGDRHVRAAARLRWAARRVAVAARRGGRAQARAIAERLGDGDRSLAEIAAAADEPLHARSKFTLRGHDVLAAAYAAVVEIDRATGALRHPALRRGRRRGHDRQPAARARPGRRRHRAGARRSASSRRSSTTRRPARARASLLDYSLPTAAEMPPLRDRRRRVAVAAQPARREGRWARAARSARCRRSRTRSPTRSAGGTSTRRSRRRSSGARCARRACDAAGR